MFRENLMKNQKGASGLSIMMILFLSASILTVAFKVIPLYMDNMTIAEVLDGVGDKGDITAMSDDDIVRNFNKRLTINNVRDFDNKNFVINRDDGLLTIDINYEKREHIFKNIDVVVSFENHFETKAK